MQGEQLQSFIIDKISDIKAQDILSLDVKDKSSITDWMVVCTGTSSRHIHSIADHLVQASKQVGVVPLNIDSQRLANWVVVDYGDVIVHVMQEDSRALYQLEKLWG